MTVSEETSLLNDDEGDIMKHELIYKRFSTRQKRFLVTIVSGCGLLPRGSL